MLAILASLGLVAAMSGSEFETFRQAGAKSHIDIGTAVTPAFLLEPRYEEILGKEFNVLEPENAMKFESIHPRPDSDPSPYRFGEADRLAEFARAHRMKMRGHTLVWHNQQPHWLSAEGTRPVQLADTLLRHITTVMERYSKSIYAWDVVNEAFNEDGSLRSTLWYDKPGIGFAGQGTKYIEQSFRWARAADKRANLFYNDYEAETINAKSDGIYAMCKDFVARKVPMDGIGFQAHIDLSFNRPEVLKSFEENLKRFADLGLEIHVTELDVRLKDGADASLAAQADLYRKVVEICRRQPKVKLIQIWGFTDKHSWIPGWHKGQGWALPWDENYMRKPAYGAILGALSGP